MSFLDLMRNGMNTFGGPVRSMVGSLAPIAGGLIGGSFGGPLGATVGAGLGSGFGSWLNSGNPHGYQVQQNGMQQSPGQILGNGFSQMVPSQYRNQTFGQMGQNLQGQAGDYLNNYMGKNMGSFGSLFSNMGIGNRIAGAAGDWLGNRLNNYSPGIMGQTPNQVASGFGQSMGQRFPSYNSKPYFQRQDDGGMAPGMGGYHQGQMSQVGQVPDYRDTQGYDMGYAGY